jgi:hypothetical protein
VDVYVTWFNRLKNAGVPVEIKGICISACTLVLMLPKDQVCTDKTASFGFHLAARQVEDKLVSDEGLTGALIRRYYPAPLQEWLKTQQLTPNITFMPAEEAIMLGIVEECKHG